MDTAVIAAIVMLVSVVGLLVLGAPIATALGAGSGLAMLIILPFDTAMLTSAQKMFTGLASFPLLAIPFFVLAGNLMNNGGVALRIIRLGEALCGRLPGALAQSNIVANMFFGAISGSGNAAAAAMGGTLGPVEKERGYSVEYSTAVNIASAPTGMLIPPSNALIVFTTVATTTSVAGLFMAGYIPGILWGISVMIVAGYMAKKRGYINPDKVSWAVKGKYFLEAIPSLFLIVIVIGGILSGIFTATEASGVAVAYSLILGLGYRTLKLKDLPGILLASARTTAIIVFLIAVSSIMSWVMAYTQIPAMVSNAMLALTDSKIATLLLINLILLLLGCVMDLAPLVLIMAPILLPVVTKFGMSPIQFGVMMMLNLGIGLCTPPVGTALFTGCAIGNMKIEKVSKAMLPLYIPMLITLLLVTFIPALTMTLPELIMK